jgi:dipeptidyl aminopeptidase/acylaminoacyl peptidase
MFDTRAAARALLGAALCLSLVACAAPRTAPPADTVEQVPRRIGNLEVYGVPDIPPALFERLQQYRNIRTARFQGWLDDGVLIATRFGDTQQLHRVTEPGGTRAQLTFFDEPVAEALVPPVARPDGIVYLRDAGGSEFFQLYRFDLASRQSRLLSDGRSRYTEVVWADDGERFAYTTTERTGRHWDIHVQDLAGNVRAVLESDDVGWVVQAFSPDGQRLLLSRYVSINESYLYELSLQSLALTPLLDRSLTVAVRQADYTPDGRGVYFSADLGAEFLRLHRLDLASGAVSVLTGDIAWDVEAFAVAPGGKHLAFTVNEGGYSRLYVWRLPMHAPLALPEMPRGVISELMFHPDGGQIGFTLSLPTAPADVYSLDLERRALTRWTTSEVGGLDPQRFVTPDLIDYPTFDQVNGEPRRIPAFVYRPEGPGPYPVYISIHGGPEAQYRPYFSAALQYYASELGMAVVVPNVRGSAGYGKSYLKLDNGMLREDSVRDIGALLDWIGTQPDLDAARVVVSGGSYGGYMVLASLVHYGDRLTAGVERVGISNFVSFLSNTEDYRRSLRRAEYGDERDPQMRAFLESISPLNHVDRMTRPLLIIQGANDPRVPASESEQIHRALLERGVPVWYVLALDEGHGFRKKPNSDYAAAATALFLQHFVLEGAAP